MGLFSRKKPVLEPPVFKYEIGDEKPYLHNEQVAGGTVLDTRVSKSNRPEYLMMYEYSMPWDSKFDKNRVATEWIDETMILRHFKITKEK